MGMRCWASWGLVFLSLGCGSKSSPTAPKVAQHAPARPWDLVCLDPASTTPALLWNGLIGVRLNRAGEGTGQPFFAIDEYETTGEEKIRTLESPMAAKLTIGDEVLGPEKGTDYEQTLDMRKAVLVTSWKQETAAGSVLVEVRDVVHPTQRVVASRWQVTASKDAELKIEISQPVSVDTSVSSPRDNEMRGSLLVAGKPGAAVLVRDRSYQNGTWSIVKGASTVSTWVGKGRFNSPFVIEHVVSLGRSPNFEAMMSARHSRAEIASPFADNYTFGYVAAETTSEWRKRWNTDIEIDGPVEDQQAIRSFLFYLRSAISPEGKMSISPFGLSNQMYNGHVFWDADIWVFPALALVDPEGAKAIGDYRLSLSNAASQNFDGWLKAGRPTASGKLGLLGGEELSGLKYPWESSVSGGETVRGPSQFEDHISGSVAFASTQRGKLGFGDPSGENEFTRIGMFYAVRSDPFAQSIFKISGTMSPDENHVGDNDLYTNILAQTFMGSKYELPHDDKSFLTYDKDTVKSYKQAAAVLAIYPLQYPPAEKEAKVMMDRFADKVIKTGPAMSDSVHGLIWARLGDVEKGYDAWRKSWVDFTNNPLMLFSEKRNKPVTYFTTGAAGSLQTVMYGFLGIRIDSKEEPGAAWTKKLRGNGWLSIKPNLPKQWKSVKFKNFTLLGQRYTLTTTATTTKVSQGD